jgi:hypothetical protein
MIQFTQSDQINWASHIGTWVAVLGLVWTVAKTGAKSVQTMTQVSERLDALRDVVTGIKDSVNVYIASDGNHTVQLTVWQRDIESRISGIEATLRIRRKEDG